jgi:hypothetical protein
MDDIDNIISIDSIDSSYSHDDDGDNNSVLQSVARRISKVMIDSNNNTTSMKKLFTILLECNDDIKYKNNVLIQNKIDYITKDLEEEMDVFIKRCKPIIDQNIPIPVLVRGKSDELLLEDAEAGEEEDEAEDEDEKNITPSKFSKGIKEFLSNLLNRELYDNRDDDRGWDDYRGLDCDRDTEQELENVLRIYPDVLKYPSRIFGCRSMKYITFIPMVA